MPVGQLCAGLGVSLCKETYEFSIGARVGFQQERMRATLKASRNKDSSLTLSTTYTLQTSTDPGTPSNHVFLTPILNVKYSETANIQFNVSNCSATRDNIITWSLTAQDNVNAFSINTYMDVKFMEVGHGLDYQ